jgi:hypothetical protein
MFIFVIVCDAGKWPTFDGRVGLQQLSAQLAVHNIGTLAQ